MNCMGFRIEIEQGETGLYFATSPDLKGLFVAERSMEAVTAEIPRVIEALQRAAA